jgi:hypothetical protein
MHFRRSKGVRGLLQDPKVTLRTQFRVLVRVLAEARDRIRAASVATDGVQDVSLDAAAVP